MGEVSSTTGHRQEHARAALAEYAARQPAAEPLVRRMLTLLNDGSAAFARDHFSPGHFTASAFVISPDEQQLLLIHHAKLHLWLQPGGHVEPEDGDLIVAARRELAEEVGIDDAELLGEGIFDLDIHAIPEGRDPRHHHFDVRYLFRARTHQLTAASDALAARWVALEQVANQNSDASVMRAVSRLRELFPAGGA